jgi:uncharacterized membrane protein YdjX (TVP38/TMEM64 family)
MDKSKKQKAAIYIVFISAFLGLLVYLAVRFGPQLTDLAGKPEDLKELLNSYGWKGIIIFIGIQILQVVVAAIPGEVVQLAGGYIYGTWLGTLYSLLGIVPGSVLVFFIARLLGYPLVKLFVSKNQLEKFNFMINSNKSEIAMFILFLIPGIPKDILTYIAGITPVKPLKFFAIIIIGRLPALLASSYIGSSAQKGNYGVVIALSAAVLVLFVAGVLLKDKIISKVHKISGKKDETDNKDDSENNDELSNYENSDNNEI